MKKSIGLFLVFFSFNLLAFDKVTEVLVSGNIIICKKSTQELNGNVVGNYKLKNSFNRFDTSKIKIDEFKLPKIGDKIKITRSENVKMNKFESKFINSDVGEAIVVEQDLSNELRNLITYPGGGIHIENQVAFTESEKDRVRNECIVASPVGSAKFKNLDLVKI